VIRAEDGGHDVSAKSRAGHQQIAAGGINLQAGAVRGQAGMDAGRQAGGQIAADGRGAEEQNGRLEQPHRLGQSLGVRLCAVGRQSGIIPQENPVRAVAGQILFQAVQPAAQENGRDPGVQGLGQIPRLAQKFVRNAGNLVVHLLNENTDSCIPLYIHEWFSLLLVFCRNDARLQDEFVPQPVHEPVG
jgi:hypothetical protein